MKKRKGFTLIELLAVMVILAVIMVIAVPKILNVINNAEIKSEIENADLIVRALKIKSALNELDNSNKFAIYSYENGDLTSSVKLNAKGKNPYYGKIIQNNNKIALAYISSNQKYCIVKKYNDKKSNIYNYTNDKCIIENEEVNIDDIIESIDSSLDDMPSIIELEYEIPLLTSNISYGEVTSDTIYGTQHDVYYAFDGVKSGTNKWLNKDTTSGYIKRRLEEPCKITSFNIYGSDMSSRTPKTVELYGSNDDENYVLLASNNLEQLGVSTYKTVEVPVEKQNYYTYYKWNFPDGNYGDSVGIAVGEIEIKAYKKYDVSSGSIEYSIPTLTSNTSYGEVTSDTIYGTQHDVYYAFDGVKSGTNKWLNKDTTSGYIKRRLEEPCKITSFNIYGSDMSSRTPKTVELYGSNDDENYVLLASNNLEQLGVSTYKTVEVPVEKQNYYTYYKWNFPDGNYGGSVGIAVGEIEIKSYRKYTNN